MQRLMWLSLLALTACLSRDARDKGTTDDTAVPESDADADSDADSDTDSDTDADTDADSDSDADADSDSDADADTDSDADSDTNVPEDFDEDGYLAQDDCDDTNTDIYPGAPEHCDGVDEDCDGAADNNAVDMTTWYRDVDSDGYGGTTTRTACEAPSGYVAEGGDCNDNNAGVSPGQAEVWQTPNSVDDDCNGYTDEIRVPTDYTTIQAVINLYRDPVVILVEPGTYYETLSTTVYDTTIVGEGGSSVTTIDGSGRSYPVIRAQWVQNLGVLTLEGLTLTGGTASDGYYGGAGLSCGNATIVGTDLVIEGNTMTGYGGGVGAASSCVMTLSQSIIAGNTASGAGGGLSNSSSTVTLRNVIVADNTGSSGGGLYAWYGTTTLDQVDVVGNSASGVGGAMAFYGSPTTVNATGNIVYGNTSGSSGGGVYAQVGTGISFLYSLIYGNTQNGVASEVSGITFTAGSNGNLSTDPLFVSYSASGSWTSWDLGLSTGSPAIDAGDPSDYDTDGSRADMGAYGGALGDWP